MAERHVTVRCEGADGIVDVRLLLGGVGAGTEVELGVGEARQKAAAFEADGGTFVEATIRVADAERWWPHTHGAQPLYPVRVRVDDVDLDAGTVGFRTVEVDRAGGAFSLAVNGVPIFCRGAFWIPPTW